MERIDWARLTPWVLTAGAGVVGRLMYHARQVQLGKKTLSWALIWDIPIALGTGWIALGVCKWAGLQWETTVSVAIVAGYLGPYGIDTIFTKWSDMKFGKKEHKDVEVRSEHR